MSPAASAATPGGHGSARSRPGCRCRKRDRGGRNDRPPPPATWRRPAGSGAGRSPRRCPLSAPLVGDTVRAGSGGTLLEREPIETGRVEPVSAGPAVVMRSGQHRCRPRANPNRHAFGIEESARDRRPPSAEPKARREIRNQASSRAPPFHPRRPLRPAPLSTADIIPDQGIVPCFTLLSRKEQGRSVRSPRPRRSGKRFLPNGLRYNRR